MRIVIVALGTRGDLQPFVALAVGLQAAGYAVRVVSAKGDAASVQRFGIEYFPLDVDIQEIVAGPEGQARTKSDNPLKFIKSHLSNSAFMKGKMAAVQEEIWQGCQGADAIVYHAGMANVYFMARELGVPGIMASPFPLSATADYPALLFYAGPRLGRAYNRLTHFIFERAFWLLSRSAAVAFWRKRPGTQRPGLTPPSVLQLASGQPVLAAYSPQLFAPDATWPANLHVTGAWHLPEEPAWQPPAALREFLAAGPPPVYVGFGSMLDASTFDQTLAIVLEALALANCRGVLALGWNQEKADTALPASVFRLGSAPHGWLFPQMAAVVHHGGAGTTAAGLLAGKPTVVVPHGLDQPAWGQRVHELGAGPRPIPKRELTAARLAAAIQETASGPMLARAAHLGQQLRAENGVGAAVQVVHDFLQGAPANGQVITC